MSPSPCGARPSPIRDRRDALASAKALRPAAGGPAPPHDHDPRPGGGGNVRRGSAGARGADGGGFGSLGARGAGPISGVEAVAGGVVVPPGGERPAEPAEPASAAGDGADAGALPARSPDQAE